MIMDRLNYTEGKLNVCVLSLGTVDTQLKRWTQKLYSSYYVETMVTNIYQLEGCVKFHDTLNYRYNVAISHLSASLHLPLIYGYVPVDYRHVV